MDYNDFELVAFWVLALAAALPLAAIGILVHVRGGARAPGLYLVLGTTASIVYGYFAGLLVGTLFPPPYVPGLSEGRGLDLRGLALIFGSWIGGALGVLTTLVTFAVSKTVQWRRARRALQDLNAGLPGTSPH
ncbi:hypothetical protein [Paeniglutamicibacter sp.]|uniref:hypothetical protein n=1 Tax=Paeniglutamicibacter sp. TaxID=1934391 RepID=UPI003988DFB0